MRVNTHEQDGGAAERSPEAAVWRPDQTEPMAAEIGDPPGTDALTAEQQLRVRENLGLVAVHLRRRVPNLGQPRRDREWDDLFQEGCLGLVQAAVTYRADSGIPFAAFALARIHSAVSRALHTRFSTVRIPPVRRRGSRTEAMVELERGRRPGVVQLGAHAARQLPDRRKAAPISGPRETIGTRLRAKYERAVRAAGERLAGGVSTRGDRERLIEAIIKERLLVPAEEKRAPLRQLARETHSSYARVAQCEKQLIAVAREELEADPEFIALRQWSRVEGDGVELALDAGREQELAQASWIEFRRRYENASDSERAALVHTLLEVSRCGIIELAAACYAGLAPEEREHLLRHPSSGAPKPCRRRAG